MPGKNGWKTHLITMLSTASITMGVAMATIGAGKADKDDLEELQDRDVQQQVINEKIDGRLKRIEEKQEDFQKRADKAHGDILEQLRGR